MAARKAKRPTAPPYPPSPIPLPPKLAAMLEALIRRYAKRAVRDGTVTDIAVTVNITTAEDVHPVVDFMAMQIPDANGKVRLPGFEFPPRRTDCRRPVCQRKAVRRG